MDRGDYVVRFRTYRWVGQMEQSSMGSSVFRDVHPLVHASGALEVIEPGGPDRAARTVVMYGPSAWHSVTQAPARGDDHED